MCSKDIIPFTQKKRLQIFFLFLKNFQERGGGKLHTKIGAVEKGLKKIADRKELFEHEDRQEKLTTFFFFTLWTQEKRCSNVRGLKNVPTQKCM